jgi:hypothetical protein
LLAEPDKLLPEYLLEPLKALYYVKHQIDKRSVSSTLDFELSKEHIWLEVKQSLIDDIFSRCIS